MRRIASLASMLLISSLLGGALPAAAQVSVQHAEGMRQGAPAFRWPQSDRRHSGWQGSGWQGSDWRGSGWQGPNWRDRRRDDRRWRPDHPGRPHQPSWPGMGPGAGFAPGFGLSLDLGAYLPGAEGSVREPVMTIERGSPDGTRQIRNAPGAPAPTRTAPADPAPEADLAARQPPIVPRAPSSGSGAPVAPRQGAGALNGGGSALGQILSADGENYVFLLTLPESRTTCTGQIDGPPELFATMSSALACTDGTQGNALFATPETGEASSVSFTLDGARGGYLVFP